MLPYMENCFGHMVSIDLLVQNDYQASHRVAVMFIDSWYHVVIQCIS